MASAEIPVPGRQRQQEAALDLLQRHATAPAASLLGCWSGSEWVCQGSQEALLTERAAHAELADRHSYSELLEPGQGAALSWNASRPQWQRQAGVALLLSGAAPCSGVAVRVRLSAAGGTRDLSRLLAPLPPVLGGGGPAPGPRCADHMPGRAPPPHAFHGHPRGLETAGLGAA